MGMCVFVCAHIFMYVTKRVCGRGHMCVRMCVYVCVYVNIQRHKIYKYNDLDHLSLSIFCNTLQHTATHCNTLQHTAAQTNSSSSIASISSAISRSLFTATLCNSLQRTATHYNTLQHTATHCNALQHRPIPAPQSLPSAQQFPALYSLPQHL